MIVTGRVHRFGESLTTDDIIAGKYKHETTDLDRLAPHLMENIRPGFADEVRRGDFVVAGRNFGYGSSREQAPRLLARAGVTAVVAPSFARIFFRNAINIGLLQVCPTDQIAQGDVMTYDDETGALAYRGAHGELLLHPAPIPADMLAIVQAGGLLPYVKARGTL
jgi:3-isopropylmalate/(R)-2-methylmalate dehydratase small subunit